MPDDGEVAAGRGVDPVGWREMFDELMFLVAGRFGRVEPRRTAREFVLGLLSSAEWKNCWWLAEQAGHRDPHEPFASAPLRYHTRVPYCPVSSLLCMKSDL